MNALLISNDPQLASDVRCQIDCGWEDAAVTMLCCLDQAANDPGMFHIVFIDIEDASPRRLQIIQEIRRSWQTPVVALTRRPLGVKARVASLRAGADEVWDDFPPDTILFTARIESLLRLVHRSGQAEDDEHGP